MRKCPGCERRQELMNQLGQLLDQARAECTNLKVRLRRMERGAVREQIRRTQGTLFERLT